MLIKLKKMKSCVKKNKRMKRSLERRRRRRRRKRRNKSKNKKINTFNIKMKTKKIISNSAHEKSLKIHYQQLINIANYLLKFDMTLIS